MSGKVYPLEGAQREAANPQGSVWLSASAGTGKTQVLSARVLRLLLEPDVHPSQILCLTFTKAGAAEMAVRVNEVLARWVRLPATQLYAELFPKLAACGLHALMGGITLPNEASVALHEKFGMRKVAHFDEVGFKFGRWLPVGYWQRTN